MSDARVLGTSLIIEQLLLLEGEDTAVNVPRQQLPRKTCEGDYLQIELVDGQVVKAELDPKATEQARVRIQAKLERLRRGDHLSRNPKK